MRIKHLIIGTTSFVALSAFAITGAYAQDAQASGSDTPVGELIVTAQKREQRLQDVPVEVTVVGAQLLQDAGVKDIKDLTLLTPGLTVTSSSSEASTTARIRGIGTVGDNPGLESSVGVVVDGIYRPRNGVALTDLGELSRVEVLKGPQGTLFGKNATAGVINVVTASPSFNPSATAEVTGGNFSDYRGAFSVTGPLIGDKLAGRLFVAGESRDGYQSVITGAGPRTQDNDMNRHFGTARGQLLWLPTNNLDVKLIADYTKRDEDCCTAVNLVTGSFATTVTNSAALGGVHLQVPGVPASRVTYSDQDTSQNTTDEGVSLETNWSPGGGNMKVTSLTALRRWKVSAGQDADFTTLDLLHRAPDSLNFTTFDQGSEELRFSGDTGRVNWVFGGFYGNEKLVSSQTLTVGSNLTSYLDVLLRTAAAAPTALGGTGTQANPVTTGGLAYILGPSPNFTAGGTQYDVHHQLDESKAGFFNADAKLTDTVTATLGVRYTEEDKHLVSHYTNTGGNGTCNLPLFLNGAATRAAAGGTLAQRLFVGYYCAAYNDSTFNNLSLDQNRSDQKTTGTFKLSWKPSNKVFGYVSYAHGFKAGGFNLDRERINGGGPLGLSNGALAPDTATDFAPEMVDSYEAGLKTTWLNGRLLVNGAVFYQDYTDFQLNAFDGIAFTVSSIPKVTTKGADFDVLWQTPVHGLTLQGGVTFAETMYGRNLPGYNVSTSPFYIGPTAATSGALFRLSGNTISFAPRWSGSLSGTYEHALTSTLILRANVSAKYNSSYNTGSDLNPAKLQPSYTLVDARIGIGAANGLWMLEAWSQNLTDVHYAQVAFDATFQPNQIDAFMGAPRTVGVTLRVKPWGHR